MQVLQDRKARIVLLLALVAFTLFRVTTQLKRTQQERHGSLEAVPEYDTGGKVPGNPANAEKDLKLIYKSINIYRAKNGGRYPASQMDLFSAVGSSPQAYGFKNRDEAHAAFTNPDARYSDSPVERASPDHFVAYRIKNKRPDGLPIGSPKPSNTRDVLAVTSVYRHVNVKRQNGRPSSHPVGFYVVLWDDGKIQKVPYDQELLVPKRKKEWATAFPGQAGLPSGTLTYDQFYISKGIKPPRGNTESQGAAVESK